MSTPSEKLDSSLKLEPVRPPGYADALMIMVSPTEYKALADGALVQLCTDSNHGLAWWCDCDASADSLNCAHVTRVQEQERTFLRRYYPGRFEQPTPARATRRAAPAPRPRSIEDDDPDIEQYSAPGPSPEQRARVAQREQERQAERDRQLAIEAAAFRAKTAGYRKPANAAEAMADMGF